MHFWLPLILALLALAAGGLWASRLVRDRLRLLGALSRSEAHREAITQSALDCVVEFDLGARITYFNRAAERTFGCTASDARNRLLTDFVRLSPFGPSRPEELVQGLKTGDPRLLGSSLECQAVRASGVEFPILLNLARFGSEGRLNFAAHIREISELRQGETALFERASMAAMNMEISVAMAKADGLRSVLQRCMEIIVSHLDATLARIWLVNDRNDAFDLAATAGLDLGSAEDPSTLPIEGSNLGRYARSGRPHVDNHASVEAFDFEQQEWALRENITAFAAYPLQNEARVVGVLTIYDRKPLPEGLTTRLASVGEGITQFIERARAESHVREQAALLEKATDAIVVRELDGRIRFWNKGAERVYGWIAAEAVGRRFDELIAKPGGASKDQALTLALVENEWAGEQTHRHRDGREVIVSSRWTLLRDDHGTPQSVLIIATDITEKRQLERKFLRTQRLETIGTLAGGIAHDLNNILGPILNSTQLLRTRQTDARSQTWLNVMENNARRGAALVRQILAFASGYGRERGVLLLNHLIRDIEYMVRQTFPPSIHIKTETARDLWAIDGDATQFHQVLLNLCVNARDAMARGGSLSVRASNVEIRAGEPPPLPALKAGRYVRLEVEDTGSGIPAEIQSRIFEPFFTTKEPGRGTGLGLSTVQNIIQNHSGVMALKSTEDKGTTFTIFLPALAAPPDEEIQRNLAEGLAGNGELVLLVDDELSIREITKATLENYGYRVLTAADGVEAINLFTQNQEKIGAVIMDLLLPHLGGRQAIESIRIMDAKVPIIAISGTEVLDELSGFDETNRVAFLAKPFNSRDLLGLLHLKIRRPRE
jgi:two-component system cell cycle sensor histidine kinase/response regulator CckA